MIAYCPSSLQYNLTYFYPHQCHFQGFVNNNIEHKALKCRIAILSVLFLVLNVKIFCYVVIIKIIKPLKPFCLLLSNCFACQLKLKLYMLCQMTYVTFHAVLNVSYLSTCCFVFSSKKYRQLLTLNLTPVLIIPCHLLCLNFISFNCQNCFSLLA